MLSLFRTGFSKPGMEYELMTLKHILKKTTEHLGIGARTCNPRTLEIEAGGSRVRGHCQLWSKFQANLLYMRPCLKKPQSKTKQAPAPLQIRCVRRCLAPGRREGGPVGWRWTSEPGTAPSVVL